MHPLDEVSKGLIFASRYCLKHGKYSEAEAYGRRATECIEVCLTYTAASPFSSMVMQTTAKALTGPMKNYLAWFSLQVKIHKERQAFSQYIGFFPMLEPNFVTSMVTHYSSAPYIRKKLRRGHSFNTYARRGGQANACVQEGGGLTHLRTYAEKFPFGCILLYFRMQGTFIILCCLS